MTRPYLSPKQKQERGIPLTVAEKLELAKDRLPDTTGLGRIVGWVNRRTVGPDGKVGVLTTPIRRSAKVQRGIDRAKALDGYRARQRAEAQALAEALKVAEQKAGIEGETA